MYGGGNQSCHLGVVKGGGGGGGGGLKRGVPKWQKI